MISSTTLILASLVFNAASILGAPIRIPAAAPDVVKRAPAGHAQPAMPILPRVAVVDAQPLHKRSVDGTANRPRLAREVVPEHETRDTASESVEIRDSPLPEVEKIVRRFPRRHLAEFYEKRSPEPAPSPAPPSDPSPQAEARSEPEPPVERRFPRRALFDRHAQRSADPEPAPPIEARNEYDPDGHFVRDHNPELMAKRDAIPTDNVPREPEPAPAPAPNPAPAENSEQVRRFPRRVYADYYTKRQDNEDPAKPVETPPATPSSTTTSSTSTSTATTSTTSSTATSLPASLEKAIADAIVKGSNNAVTNSPTAGKKSSYSDTTITIKITHQANSDVTTPEKPKGSSTDTPPPTSTSSSSTTPTPTASSTASPTSTTTDGTPKPSETSTGSPSPAEEKPTGDSKPEESGATGGSSTDGGESAPPTERRNLSDSNAADEPLTKRNLGLSGALWASWSRRNIQKD